MNANKDFLLQMREATALLHSNGPAAATAAIQRALHGGHVANQPRTAPQSRAAIAANDRVGSRGFPDSGAAPARDASIIDVEEIATPSAVHAQFLQASLRNQSGARDYKLFIPSTYSKTNSAAHPLIVMLHGCKQNPDDFAAGTQMNQIAEEHRCLIVYPAQAQTKNMSNCWNWFNATDQQRDRGEPSIIADITRRIMDEYNIDRRRVYVAGLSAGGAMAAIMGKTYPDLFAAIGVHSGLPVGAAHDVASALGAMQNGARGSSGSPGSAKFNSSGPTLSPPIIVFHGDADRTVHVKNAEQLMSQFTPHNTNVAAQRNELSANGMRYTQTKFRDTTGGVVAESWLIHGAGHAWSGGSATGSYTSAQGPSASREMVRFFLARTNLT
jgi:poly(hydroxyalkanoate) depolymerase family esterase